MAAGLKWFDYLWDRLMWLLRPSETGSNGLQLLVKFITLQRFLNFKVVFHLWIHMYDQELHPYDIESVCMTNMYPILRHTYESMRES